MDLAATLAEIASLSVDERIRLIEAVWDTIAAEPDRLELTDAQREELDRRLAAYAESPDCTIPWEDVKAQALARVRR
jgi:putative addiction module component (TIGR02574 family)